MRISMRLKSLAAAVVAAVCAGSAVQVQAAPFVIPQPSLQVCRNDNIMQQLTDSISSGALRGDDNLLASLNFVQDCQDLLHSQSETAGR